MKKITALLLAGCLLLAHSAAFSQQAMATAHLPGGLALQIINRSVSCDGKPGAFVIDKSGEKVDQTCNLHFSANGVSILFAGYQKRMFFPKEQFDVFP
jgi:hypothetical protein